MDNMRKIHVISALFATVLCVVTQPTVHAATIAITNPGFESYVLADGASTTSGTGLTSYGWTVSASPSIYVGVWNPTSTHFPAGIPEGVNVAYCHGCAISQTLTETLAANIIYSLQVDIGYAKYGFSTPFGGYTVQLLAGGNLLTQDQSPPIPAVGGFLTSTVTFTANASNLHLGQALEIRLLSDGQETIFDNVRLEAVPVYGCVGFESPLADPLTPVTIRKPNRALPFKAMLVDGDGNPVTDSTISAPPVIQVTYTAGTGGEATDISGDTVAVGLGTVGNQFVFTDDEKWQFNLKLGKNDAYSAPGTYKVKMAPGDTYDINPTCEASFVIQ